MADERGRNNEGPGFLSGFILGGLIGAAAALLYGRREEMGSWEQLRDRSLELRRQSDEVSTRARETLEEMNQRSRLLLEEVREVLRQAIEEGRESATRTMAELQARFQELRGEATGKTDGSA
ncbi:MAG TPA: YtxH domain-containing protein [Dehalococcoidia bacterium]|nr:YtxH domain-containing protein [Dehalococcoidia bacterium]